jgi:starch-binding outer membrane protein, SusD/RagB family
MKTKSIFFISIVAVFASCSLVDVEISSNEIVDSEAIKTQSDLNDLLNSSYDVLANYKNGLSQRLLELQGDNIAGNFSDAAGFLKEVYNRNTNFFNSDVGSYYKEPYFAIHRANTLLENVDNILVPDKDRTKMIAEARFVRAVSHLDLLNLMAHPSGYTTDDSHLGISIRKATGSEPELRSTVKDSYAAIKSDLRFAEENLPESNGVKATSYAAQGYLAKVYFQERNYDSAIYYTSQILDPSTPFSLSMTDVSARYKATFSALSSEVIFRTVSVVGNENRAADNRSGVFTGSYRSDINEPQFKITQDLYNLATTNSSDDRADWFDEVVREDGSTFYVTNKFNRNLFNIPLIHMVDMLLTRAESYAILNNLDAARADVDRVRNRAGLAGLSPVSTQPQLLAAIRDERRIEMSLEGDRVLQLKRRGADGESILIRGAEWNCDGLILQFPATEGFPGFVFNETGGC